MLARLVGLAASRSHPQLRAVITGLPVAGFLGTLAPGQSVFGSLGGLARESDITLSHEICREIYGLGADPDVGKAIAILEKYAQKPEKKDDTSSCPKTDSSQSSEDILAEALEA